MEEREWEEGKSGRRLGLFLGHDIVAMPVFTYNGKTVIKDKGVRVNITSALFEAKITTDGLSEKGNFQSDTQAGTSVTSPCGVFRSV